MVSVTFLDLKLTSFFSLDPKTSFKEYLATGRFWLIDYEIFVLKKMININVLPLNIFLVSLLRNSYCIYCLTDHDANQTHFNTLKYFLMQLYGVSSNSLYNVTSIRWTWNCWWIWKKWRYCVHEQDSWRECGLLVNDISCLWTLYNMRTIHIEKRIDIHAVQFCLQKNLLLHFISDPHWEKEDRWQELYMLTIPTITTMLIISSLNDDIFV